MEIKNSAVLGAATPDATRPNRASASASTGTRQSGAAITVHGKAPPLTCAQNTILEHRGIDVELAVRMGWRSAARSGSGDEIEIPYYRDGKEVNCKTRTLSGEKRFFQVEGADKCLYNLDAIKDLGDAPLVITEGEMDCMIALQCGFVAVSVPDGAPKEAIGDKETRKYEYLRDIPSSIQKIILATDSDNAGANLLQDLSIRLGKHRCMWVKYPVGCKDLNDVFMRWRERGVTETLGRAQYLRIEGLHRMSELPPVPVIRALDVGIPALSEHFRLRPGDFSVVTGIPSLGKTTWTNNIAFNMARNHGWQVCFASFEQKPQTEHRFSLRTLYAGRPADCLELHSLTAADRWIDEQFSFIVPDENGTERPDLTWLKDRMAAAVTRFGAKLIVIDPWNEIDHDIPSASSLTQYVGDAIKDLKRFAQRFAVHVMVVAHPAKLQKKDGKYPVPTAYDISDSSHWYNKPEQIVIVHRNDDGTTLLKVAKSRYHRALGKPGDITLKFNDHDHTFS